MPPPTSRTSTLGSRKSYGTLQSIPEQSLSMQIPPAPIRRGASASKVVNPNVSQKIQRTSKTSQKLVVLPSEPQTKPLPTPNDDEAIQHRSEGERMNKIERKRAGCHRLTAYSTAEGCRMKLLAAFAKREHRVSPRVFDEALYAVGISSLSLQPSR